MLYAKKILLLLLICNFYIIKNSFNMNADQNILQKKETNSSIKRLINIVKKQDALIKQASKKIKLCQQEKSDLREKAIQTTEKLFEKIKALENNNVTIDNALQLMVETTFNIVFARISQIKWKNLNFINNNTEKKIAQKTFNALRENIQIIKKEAYEEMYNQSPDGYIYLQNNYPKFFPNFIK